MDLYALRIAEQLGVLAPAVAAEQPAQVRRKVRSGRWQRAGRCVVTHSGPLTADQLLWCAVLSPVGPVAIARETALCAGGLRGLHAVPLTLVTPLGHHPPSIRGVRYVQTRHLESLDLVPHSLPPRTTTARALVDAASRTTRDRARTLVAMTIQQRKATAPQVRAVLARLGPVRQEVLLRVTLDDVEGGAHSLPELNFLRLLRQARLPLPTRQAIRQRANGRWYLDVAWEQYGLVGEVDGSHHRDVEQWEADVLRQDELVISGDAVLRLLSWWIRDRPEMVTDLVRRALVARGWTGSR